jgi:hypothetical protein
MLSYQRKNKSSMQYFVLGMSVGAFLFIARSAYLHLERWERSKRLRGAKACLDAVRDTLDGLAKSNPAAQESHESKRL